MKKRYDVIYSIGADCYSAATLKRYNLRSCSGPFDWLICCPFEDRMKLILDDFKDFLNSKDLKKLEKNLEPQHKSYKNIRNGFNYLHDFPNDVAFKDSFPVVKDKYDRRVERFLSDLKNKDKVLLVWIGSSGRENIALDTVRVYQKKLSKKFGKSIDFLIIQHSEGKLNKLYDDGHVVYYEAPIFYIFEKDKKNLVIARNNFNLIFRKYTLKKIFVYVLKRRIKKIIANFMAAFVFSREKRKELRKKLQKELD